MTVDTSRTTALSALVMDRQRCCLTQYAAASIAFQMARNAETQRQHRSPVALSPSAVVRNPCVDGPRLARTCCSWGRVWSIAVMCPALVCGHVDRGPRWVTRIGSQTSRRGLRPKGFPGVFRSSVRPIAILLLSLQAPGQNAVSELFRPEEAGDKAHRLPSWPKASEPSCWPARLPQASSACALVVRS